MLVADPHVVVGRGVSVGVGVGVRVAVGVGNIEKLAVTVLLPLSVTVVVGELELPTSPIHPSNFQPVLGEAETGTTVPHA